MPKFYIGLVPRNIKRYRNAKGHQRGIITLNSGRELKNYKVMHTLIYTVGSSARLTPGLTNQTIVRFRPCALNFLIGVSIDLFNRLISSKSRWEACAELCFWISIVLGKSEDFWKESLEKLSAFLFSDIKLFSQQI